ncbi:MAG: thioredoxin domain-containing protein, partial [Planctomycetes bacterium]|nr:thioredoxin domain-containing protein [Planctomycetota bacterium]
GLDDKVLTDQNGLALEGLAWVARASGEARHAAAVRELATVLADRHSAGGLLRLPGLPAVVTDYGALACGLLAAFDLLGDPALVGRAAAVVDEAVSRLAADDGGFYTAPAGRADLVRRGREHLDNAWPSGEAQLAVAAARLHHLTGARRWRDIAAGAVSAAAGMASRAPANAATILHAATLLTDGVVAVATGSGTLAAPCRRWHGRNVHIVPLSTCAPTGWACLDGRSSIADEQLLVCRGTECLLPARTPAEALQRLA